MREEEEAVSSLALMGLGALPLEVMVQCVNPELSALAGGL